EYFEATGRRVSIEYALIRDINDQAHRAQLLADKLIAKGGLHWAHVNPIPLNPVQGSKWTASEPLVEKRFVETLRDAGISATIRDTRGSDIDGACGQLAAEVLETDTRRADREARVARVEALAGAGEQQWRSRDSGSSASARATTRRRSPAGPTAARAPCAPGAARSPPSRSSRSASRAHVSPRATPWTTWTTTSTQWRCRRCGRVPGRTPPPTPTRHPRVRPRAGPPTPMFCTRRSGGRACCSASSEADGERADRLHRLRRPRRYSGTAKPPRKEPLVSTSFERVSRVSVGYDMREVDEFLSRARTAYEGRDPAFTGADITSASFGTERGGYDMRVVDEALDRLSDAFALQARDD